MLYSSVTMKNLKKNSYLERTIKFHEIYSKEIAPIFRSYEVYRRKKIKTIKTIALIVSLLFGILCFIVYKNIYTKSLYLESVLILYIFITFFISFLILGMLFIIYFGDATKNFARTIKTDCLPRLLKVFGDVEWKNGEGIISDSDLSSCGLFADFNRRNTDDEFEGSHKGVAFKICETEMWYVSGSGKNRTCVSVFKGVIISFRSNKEIKNRTIIATKGDLTKKNRYWIVIISLAYPLIQFLMADFKNITNWIFVIFFLLLFLFISSIGNKNEEKLESIKLEDPRFCNKFNAYSSDQVEARYLLTTAFIERFQNLKTAFGAKKAKCSFYEDQIMIAISTKKNLFEIGSLAKSLENPDSINDFYDELSSIYRMVDYFKLDQKTGL